MVRRRWSPVPAYASRLDRRGMAELLSGDLDVTGIA
jgi:hypothetical protein